MAKSAGKKRRGAKAPMVEKTAPPRSEVAALELPGAPAPPTRSEVSALQLPGAPPPRTQPAIDTTRRLHGVPAPSQATSLQLPGAPPQLRQTEVVPRPLAIVPAPAHVPPQADVAWFRSLLEFLRDRFSGTVVGRILEALQGAWASVHGWWSGPPPEFDVLVVAAPELKKKKKKKDKNRNKNKKPAVPDVRRHKAFFYQKKPRPVIPPPPAPDDPQPSQPAPVPVPVIVDGVTVPAAIEERYKRYCRIAGSCSATTTVCHLCIFEEELHPNGIVRTSKMIKHCSRHSSVAVRCGRFGCAVKVPPGLDLRWHTHFCHDLPSDWWRLP